MRFSKEAQSALAAQAGYRKAVGHRFDIHEAVATAAPYSVSVLGYGAGADFLYHQGFLCYRVGHEIRLLDVHGAARLERVLDLHTVLPRLDPASTFDSGIPVIERVSLLRYSHGILVFRVEGVGPMDDALVAIHMGYRSSHQQKKHKQGRLLMHRSIPASAEIFVRHSASYLWYGTWSSGPWSVHGVDFTTQDSLDLQLDHLVDGDIGQSLCFEMYKNHLYMVSTQPASGHDEHFSSFYHWFCYAPRSGPKGHGRLWRREHREGPINELWTDLSIRTDETSGRPVILECRREWPDGKSENHRTYYTEPLPTPEEILAGASNPPSVTGDAKLNSSKYLMTAGQAYDQRPEKRLRRNYHAEYEPSYDTNQRQEFIAARTKFSGYNLAASTFVDLVNDPGSDGLRSRDRLRLRTVSRKRKCPVDEETGLLFQPTQTNPDGVPVEGSEERFASRGVHLWPADDAPAELHRILCPDARTGRIRAIADERSLIYSVSCAELLPEPPAPDHQALVLISFDPAIRFPEMGSLDAESAVAEKQSSVPRSGTGSLLREAEPLYKAIGWGYWLR